MVMKSGYELFVGISLAFKQAVLTTGSFLYHWLVSLFYIALVDCTIISYLQLKVKCSDFKWGIRDQCFIYTCTVIFNCDKVFIYTCTVIFHCDKVQYLTCRTLQCISLVSGPVLWDFYFNTMKFIFMVQPYGHMASS